MHGPVSWACELTWADKWSPRLIITSSGRGQVYRVTFAGLTPVTYDDKRSCFSARRPRAVHVVQRLTVADLFFFPGSV
jgi:hypothetical protein